jgi:Yip1 domain
MASNLTERMIRAARLDAQLYEEVEADTGALGQAMSVVVLSSLAAGIGTYSTGGVVGIVGGVLGTLVGWYLWALTTYLIGTRLLPTAATEADLGQLLRTIGFASSPGLIRVLGVIRPISGLVFLVAALWSLAAMVIGVRQALDYESTWRALGVCFIGWMVYGIVLYLCLLALGGLPASPQAYA